MSDTGSLWRRRWFDADRAALARRAGGLGREAVRPQRLGVWHTDAVRSALHSIDKVPILADERIAVRRADGPALANIDHDLELGQLDRHAVAEQVQADAMRPAQETGRRDRADCAAGEAQDGSRRLADVALRIVGPLGACCNCVDLLDLANQ